MIYELKNLDCPHCAAKIEDELKKIDGLSDATVNFASKTVRINEDLEEKAEEAIKKVDPNIKLISKKSSSFSHHTNYEDEERDTFRTKLFRIIFSFLFLIAGIILSPKLHGRFEIIEYSLFVISYILAGKNVLKSAFSNIFRGQIFDENFLMTIATLGAFAIHQLPEAASVMLFYCIGEYLQSLAVNKSRKSIGDLMDIRPDYANLVTDKGIIRVLPETVNIGDAIFIRPGEKIPLDGEVVEGASYLDTSTLTGESVPRSVETGDKIMAGMINMEGTLKVKVEKTFEDSSVSKILELVQNASSRKAKTEQIITKFARYYTPLVVLAAAAIALIPPVIIPGESFSKWIYRALTMLVISCPCALVISVPLGYFGGIGGASRKGILVKGANFIDILADLNIAVFDKTGTLTEGVFKVSRIVPVNGFTQEELLRFAAYAEAYSNHPISRSIIEAYGKPINDSEIKEYKEIAGRGVMAKVKDKQILAGNEKLLKSEEIEANLDNKGIVGTVVHIAIDDRYAGYILIADKIRQDAAKTIKELKNLGIKKVVMLTGDAKETAENVAKELGIDEYYAELLPEEKVEKLEELKYYNGSRNNTAFIGDGINDAPVLACADVGIAMGGLGSDAAIEAADIVIMEDALSKIPQAVKMARYTKKIIMQNITGALGVKLIFLAMGALGIANMWEAVFADVGVALLAVMNSIRTLRVK
ncbi:zinc-transporting ATPase [Tepidanaerobacter syntrophicus]|uniref:heavy metal translocating P-type ATPase n=1 Tax=Tepidanaerobacter syntrophicus TaxID=224999 RepID=UPI0022EF6936|nr:heavy metal translocating P-type ATPase [Tepidanaerobacter syntrophicus]GLI20015.1 zinc-transporting ATPase [Tepidanaerobacter syntrophicus]